MKIAIIGGGFMGLALAYRISELGYETKVLERADQPGGLCTYQDYGPFVWDSFYHVITPIDDDLKAFIGEIGLEKDLNWRQSLTGYYAGKKFYSLSTSKEFLRFPVLSIFDKMRLGFTLFYGSRIDDFKKLEKITAKDWLIKIGGRRTYERFWAPVLYAKLGENRDKVSAVFIWTYIKRLFRSRSSAAQKEHMGYVSGGYKTVFDRIEKLLLEKGSQMQLNTGVEEIRADPDGGGINVRHGSVTEHFDKVVFTGPLNVLGKVAAPELVTISGNTGAIEYLGVVCLVLVTKKPISPFYVLNIGDSDTPFTGVIGMSSVVDLDETAGHHITYFPKYIASDHEYWSKSDEELESLFLKGVQDMYPEFDPNDIHSAHLNRAFKVQPLQILDYSETIPKVHTKHPDFYVLNTSQFVNESVNNNSVIRHVDSFMTGFEGELQAASQNASEESSQNASKEASQATSRNISGNSSQNTARNIPKEASHKVPKTPSEEAIKNSAGYRKRA